MTSLVIDAAAVVALLADGSSAGDWVGTTLTGAHLAAPALMPYEASNVLRRLELTGHLTPEAAALAHGDLGDLAVELWPWSALSTAAWDLRGSLTAYDGSYVALASHLDVPFVTLDRKLARMAGRYCTVLAPEA